MLTSKVKKDFNRPPAEFMEGIKKFSTSIISDCLNRMKVMHSCIRPLVKRRPFAGPAFTVEEVEGGNLMSHIALDLIHPGDVLVIDAKGSLTRACWGGVQTYRAKLRKVAGVVIFGVVRDYDAVVKYNVPVFAMGMSPGGPLKGWGGFVNYPISCGGVPVIPGDIIVGDDDGVVVVPQEFIEEIIPFCEERLKKEEKWIGEIEKGKSTLDVVGLRENIKNLGIKFI